MKKIVEEFKGLLWTLAGTALVLITLSGKTKTMGLWISGIALIAHTITLFFNSDEE